MVYPYDSSAMIMITSFDTTSAISTTHSAVPKLMFLPPISKIVHSVSSKPTDRRQNLGQGRPRLTCVTERRLRWMLRRATLLTQDLSSRDLGLLEPESRVYIWETLSSSAMFSPQRRSTESVVVHQRRSAWRDSCVCSRHRKSDRKIASREVGSRDPSRCHA